MTPPQIKALNIGEQINAYIQQQRFQEILGNKKADTVRQDEMSAQLPALITKEDNHEPV